MNVISGLRDFHSFLVSFLVRPSDSLIFRRRKRVDRALRYVRSCAVCTSMLPPIDFLCDSCWQTFGRLMNRGADLKQTDYVIPTYSLLTWTPATESFVRPLVYAFKDGRAVLAAEKFATLFLSEYSHASKTPFPAVFVPAPSRHFDHSVLWTQALANQTRWAVTRCLEDAAPRVERQKELQAGERGLRRFKIQEHFAMSETAELGSKRIVFADDVVTSGSTAMAAFMALGDPERFEVWSLASCPRLATKQRGC